MISHGLSSLDRCNFILRKGLRPAAGLESFLPYGAPTNKIPEEGAAEEERHKYRGKFRKDWIWG